MRRRILGGGNNDAVIEVEVGGGDVGLNCVGPEIHLRCRLPPLGT